MYIVFVINFSVTLTCNNYVNKLGVYLVVYSTVVIKFFIQSKLKVHSI